MVTAYAIRIVNPPSMVNVSPGVILGELDTTVALWRRPFGAAESDDRFSLLPAHVRVETRPHHARRNTVDADIIVRELTNAVLGQRLDDLIRDVRGFRDTSR